MSGRLALTRRALLASLGSVAAWRPAIAAPEQPRDVGIGGTGFAPEGSAGSDRGIGGTGFVGTIQRFGSIIVNDSRIAYAQDVPVTIDGLVRSARDLRIGHVVRVVARPDAGGLVTNTIAVEREVVGPVTAVYRDGLDVLGQAVQMRSGEPSKRWRKGEHVAVSGLRRLDGTIVASLVEPSASWSKMTTGSGSAASSCSIPIRLSSGVGSPYRAGSRVADSALTRLRRPRLCRRAAPSRSKAMYAVSKVGFCSAPALPFAARPSATRSRPGGMCGPFWTAASAPMECPASTTCASR